MDRYTELRQDVVVLKKRNLVVLLVIHRPQIETIYFLFERENLNLTIQVI